MFLSTQFKQVNSYALLFSTVHYSNTKQQGIKKLATQEVVPLRSSPSYILKQTKKLFLTKQNPEEAEESRVSVAYISALRGHNAPLPPSNGVLHIGSQCLTNTFYCKICKTPVQLYFHAVQPPFLSVRPL